MAAVDKSDESNDNSRFLCFALSVAEKTKSMVEPSALDRLTVNRQHNTHPWCCRSAVGVGADAGGNTAAAAAGVADEDD